jgi:hypothetical protein
MKRIIGIASVAIVLGACADQVSGPKRVPTELATTGQESEGRGVFQRFVSIGTSVSMGWQSDGVVADGQSGSWPAQLARLADREMTQPYIDGFGCRAPIAAPLALGSRTSGESLTIPAANLLCANLQPGINLPTQNVAIASATTFNALYTTPETQADAFYAKLYPRVLPPGTTQLHAALAQNPKFISVELGANEVLSAISGVAIPGATIFPVNQWKPLYTALTDTVATNVGRGVLVGLIDDVSTFPSFRRGAELYADRATFLGGFNVQVSDDCNASNNIVFVPVVVPTAVATGVARRNANLSPFVLSCADQGFGQQDFILTPAEAAVVNATLAEMDTFIAGRAQQLGFAHFRLQALYGRSDLKPRFSVVQLMTTAQPYGSLISLDGIHPSTAGHAVLAQAAAQAINTRYQLGVPETAAFIAAR